MSLDLNAVPRSNRPAVDRPLPKAGAQPARVAQVIDLGVQPRAAFKGKEKSPVPQVLVNLELVTDEYEVEGKKVKHRLAPKAFNIVSRSSEMYGNSAIAGFLNDIDPSDTVKGKLMELADKPCLATVVHVAGTGKHQGRTFANISRVMQPPEGYPVPALSTPAMVFSFDTPSVEAWKSIPKFVQDKIKSALNYKGSKVEEMVKTADGLGDS
jgi:hypothetical protein